MKTIRNISFVLSLLLTLTAFSSPAVAYPGMLDPYFGTSGIALRDVSTSDDQIFGLATQADNKIVAVGYSEKPAQFTIARFNSNGSVDTGFGTSGVTKTSFSDMSFAYAVAIQADGKIVVVGDVGPGFGFAIARYTASGQLDTTFGTSGKVEISTQGLAGATSLVLQSDGKIVVVGYAQSGDFAVTRFTDAGALDSTFGGGDGIEMTDFFGDEDRPSSVGLQLDGKIVVAGSAFDLDLFEQFAIARYNSDGSLDTSFNVTGKVSTLIACGDEGAGCGVEAMGIQPDGKIVVTASNQDVYLARYNPDGTASGAVITTDIGGDIDDVDALAVNSFGAVLIAGSTDTAGNADFFVARYQVNGGLDTGFDNGDGIVTTSLGSNSDLAHAVAIQPNYGIILGGSKGEFGSKEFALTRYIGVAPTAAGVTISGRVTDSNGHPIRGVSMSLMNGSGMTRTTLTSTFGYFSFQDVLVGQSYVLVPSSRRYTFTPSSLFINLQDEYTDADFVGTY